MFRSTKRISGFSTCFRQWKATDTLCQFTHGYSLEFQITFEGELDNKNWVMDFGFMKRPKFHQHLTGKDWFGFMFDHTTIVAKDDPKLSFFKVLEDEGAIQLRVVDKVGCEMFAKLVFDKLNDFSLKDTNGRVRVVSVECFENENNSAIYFKDSLC